MSRSASPSASSSNGSASIEQADSQLPDQPGVSQYFGDSDLDNTDEDDEEDSYDDQDDHDDEKDSQLGSDESEIEASARSKSNRDIDMESARQEMQKIPLKTLLKAHKRLSAKEGSKRASTSKVSDDGEVLATTKHRKGREAPRRAMAPELTKRKAPVQDGRLDPERPSKGKGKVKPHRDNKHAPTEMSSKRAITRNRTVVDAPTVQRRDPRFDNLVGSYDPKIFQASYGFINQARKDEISRIRTALKATKKKNGAVDQVEREAMMQELTRLQSKQAAVEKEEREKQAMSQWKGNESKKQAEGKRTFYLKAGDRKKLLEENRMQELQKDKRKLHKVMDRKKRMERRKDFRSAPPLRQA